MKKSKKDKNVPELRVTENSCLPVGGLPETAYEMVNRYGTYEIQATADTKNQYPCIAQGFNEKQVVRDCENKHDGGTWKTVKEDKPNK